MKFFVKSSKASVDMSVISFFNYVKALLASILQENLIEHNKPARRETILAYKVSIKVSKS